jgi:hypothetical protein
MDTYAEIYHPGFVKDVQEIYWDHIHPIGLATQGVHIKSVFIDRFKPEFGPLRLVFKKYDFLAPHFLIINLDPNYSTPIHLDGAEEGKLRPISFNIPISGCNGECVTEFYDIPLSSFWKDTKTATRWLNEGASGPKIGEYRLKENPIMVCPQTPHRVNNLNGSERRITISWSLRTDWTFQQAVEYFKIQDRLILQ